MAQHELERLYGLSAGEILDAVASRFRLRAALEGGVAEVHMERHIAALVGDLIERYVAHDEDGQPDFSIWLPGQNCPLRAECKTVRNHTEAYRQHGEVVAYKVETQKTRASQGDATSRFYDIDQFKILGVCLGKKTSDWSQFLFARVTDLARHKQHSHKLATMQRVPLPDSTDLFPWYMNLRDLIRSLDI